MARKVLGRIAGAFLLAACLVAVAAPEGHAAAPSEYEVKAAFLYRIAQFVEWPEEAFADARAPVILGVLGTDPFGEALEAVRGKTVRGRRLAVRRFADIEAAKECHILFISTSEQGRLDGIMARLAGAPVLTVSDLKRFAERGGAIQLFRAENRIRFAVNLDAAERAGLRLSSRLLNLARIVGHGPGGEN